MTSLPARLAAAVQGPDFRIPHEPALALGMVLAFAAAKLVLHFVVTAISPYEIHRDEFLYLAMGQHLQLWNMDFPPAIALMAELARFVFGDTLFAIRFSPAMAGTLIIVLTGLLARELGGGRFAQGIAMLAVLAGPLFMRTASLFQPNVWDQLWWTLGLFGLAKTVQGAPKPGWGLLGIAWGFGLLTKFSILFFAFSVFVAMLLTKDRSLLLTLGPWVAAGMALLLGSPSIIGQIRLGFPVVIHMQVLRDEQLTHVTSIQFLAGQAWMIGPALVLALTGLGYLLAADRFKQFKALGITCAIAFLLLLVLHGKPYYIGPIYPALFAAGAVVVADAAGKWGQRLRRITRDVLVVAGIVSLPFGLPILPPLVMARFAALIGLTAATTTNRGTVLPLPQDYADMLGWEQQVRAVAGAFQALPLEKKANTGLMARNYGEAGALEFYAPRYGLPRRIMLPENFLLWPPDNSCSVIVTLAIPAHDLEQFFKTVTVVGRYDNQWMVDEERAVPICLAENPFRPLSEAWVRRTAR